MISICVALAGEGFITVGARDRPTNRESVGATETQISLASIRNAKQSTSFSLRSFTPNVTMRDSGESLKEITIIMSNTSTIPAKLDWEVPSPDTITGLLTDGFEP